MAASHITTLPDDKLVRTGSTLRAGALGLQADYTMGLVKSDRASLEEILGKDMLDETGNLLPTVKAIADDRTLSEEESKSKTVVQNVSVRKATRWRTKAMNAGKILMKRGVAEASNLARMTSLDKSLPNLRKEVEAKVVLLTTHAAQAPKPEWVKALAAAGTVIAAELSGADAAQEIDISALPPKTRDAWRAKGLLWTALKQINDAGHTVHSDEPRRAAGYNMSLLYRSTPAKNAPPKEPPK